MHELQSLLDPINHDPITFTFDDVMRNPPLPGLHIKGVGPISIPLCDLQAKEIINLVKERRTTDDKSKER